MKQHFETKRLEEFQPHTIYLCVWDFESTSHNSSDLPGKYVKKKKSYDERK